MASTRKRPYLDEWAKELNCLTEELYGANSKTRIYYVVVDFSNKQDSVMLLLVAFVSLLLVIGMWNFVEPITLVGVWAMIVLSSAPIEFLLAGVAMFFSNPGKNVVEISRHSDRDARLLGVALDNAKKNKKRREITKKRFEKMGIEHFDWVN